MNTASQLDREWNAIADRSVAHAFSHWQHGRPALQRFSTPSDLLEFLSTPDEERDSDESLLAIRELARTDRLAERLLLQASRPALELSSHPIDDAPLDIGDRALADAFSRWKDGQPVLARFSGPRGLLRFLKNATGSESNEPLLALLELAATDRLAGRLLLQAFLPALTSMSERINHPHRDEVWELIFFFAWETICCYPTATRRRGVAGNLVMQVLHKTTRELRNTDESATHAERVERQPRRDAAAARERPGPSLRPARVITQQAQALVRAAVASGAVADQDVELILRTRSDGVRLRRVADDEDGSYDALRMRRHRAERCLREVLAESRDVRFSGLLDLSSIEEFSPPQPPHPRDCAAPAASRDAA